MIKIGKNDIIDKNDKTDKSLFDHVDSNRLSQLKS